MLILVCPCFRVDRQVDVAYVIVIKYLCMYMYRYAWVKVGY
jgi:hypothetical protein